MSRLTKQPLAPILILLVINLAAGLLTFKDYGMSWDEPLFYNYADSIRMAYTPQAFSPGFDFYQVFGRSPEDHKIYGPAYLLLARPFQQAISTIPGVDMASSWHLVNFLTFQLGLLIFFCLARRWFSPWPAAAATAFMAWQPVFWGHAFINPKDIPFMVLFLLSIFLGLGLVDRMAASPSKPWGHLWWAALVLGLASATRVIGPLAGALIFVYFTLKNKWRFLPLFILYGVISILIMVIFWPYIWADPLNRLVEVFKHMSNNPTELAVLFEGQIFRANEMPRSYLLQMFARTLTDPTWFLFLFGCFVALRSALARRLDWRAPLVVFSLFAFMLAYLLYNKPSVYDGFRHFFFITPPIFIMIGFGFEWLFEKLKPVIWSALILVLVLPGLVGIVHLHPYEYAYYNLISGGVGSAYRNFETEYWLTCYKEAVDWTRTNEPNATLHIQREFALAQYYGAGLNLKNLEQETEADIQPGDLLLFHTRGDLDIRSVYRKVPTLHIIGRDGAEFCIIKQKQ